MDHNLQYYFKFSVNWKLLTNDVFCISKQISASLTVVPQCSLFEAFVTPPIINLQHQTEFKKQPNVLPQINMSNLLLTNPPCNLSLGYPMAISP